MKLKLIRNPNTKRNKDQEDSFETMLNLQLFFDSEKKLFKFDSWNIKNVKKLIKNKSFIKDDFAIEYESWNENISLLARSFEIKHDLSHIQLDKESKNIFLKGSITEIHHWLEVNADYDKRFSLLLFILETINDKKMIEIINIGINTNVISINSLIDIVLPFLLKGKRN